MLKNNLKKVISVLTFSILAGITPVTTPFAAELKPYSIDFENFQYPYKVNFLDLNIENQDLKMAYMDVKPTKKANGKTVVLLHGKNFNGYYWKNTIKVLADNGFRVIVPDQIGFGKSSKANIHYSFHLLASNTKKILDSLNIKKVDIIGHSMGGMLATRFSLMFPDTVEKLILENPIGLEDYKLFVPYEDNDKLYKSELNQTEESIRNYHKSYYVQWKPEYDELVKMLAGQKLSGEFPRLAMANALTYQMIYEQPVCYEFSNLKVKTLLIIGQSDRTVVGKAKVKKELLAKVGQYPELGQKTANLIKGSGIFEILNTGHIPHIEKTDVFNKEILMFLK